MAVSSTSSSIFNTSYGIQNKGMGGLLSGLDTDSLVEALTAATRSKIAKQNQQRTYLKWQQTAYRGVSSTLYAFQQSRFSYTAGSKNITSQAFFKSYTGTSSSNKVTFLSDTSSVVGSLKIDSIKQLATAEKITVAKEYSVNLSGKSVQLNNQTFTGKTLDIRLDSGISKTIKLDSLEALKPSGSQADFEAALQSLVDAAVGMRTDDSGSGQVSIVNVNVTDPSNSGDFIISLTADRNRVTVTSDNAKNVLGLSGGQSNTLDASTSLRDIFPDMTAESYTFKINGAVITLDMTKETLGSFTSKVSSSAAGVTLAYSSVTKQFTFTSKHTGASAGIDMEDVSGNFLHSFVGAKGSNSMSSVGNSFNIGRASSIDGNANAMDDVKILFEDPAQQGKKFIFSLSINGQAKEISIDIPKRDMEADGSTPRNTWNGGYSIAQYLEKAINTQIQKEFGNESEGTYFSVSGNEFQFITNYKKDVSLHLSSASGSDTIDLLGKFGFADGVNNVDSTKATLLSDLGFTGTGMFTVTVDGNTASISWDASTDSIKDVIDRINTATSGNVAELITYQNGHFDINTGVDSSGDPLSLAFEDTAGNFMKNIFGTNKYTGIADTATYLDASKTIEGKNAEIIIDGRVVTSDTNTFNIDGIGFTVNEATTSTDQPITITSVYNSDDLFDNLKSFVDEYNGLIESLQSLLYEEKDSNYTPLTDEQKAEMSESEITRWEAEAKKGLLRNDLTLRGIVNELRSTLISKVENAGLSLYDIGIEPESMTGSGYNYSKAGKLTVKEDKLRSAIENNADAIRVLFTDEKDGIAVKINKVLDKAVSSSSDPTKRGSLVRIAGTTDLTADTSSVIGDKIDKIDQYISTLKLRLEAEYNRHWSKFTALENALQRLNAQSSWLADFGSN